MDSSSTVIVALVGAAVSLTIAFLGHRRSKLVDATSAQSGVASNHRAGTAQVLEGLNDLVDQLQEDNQSFRLDIKDLAARLNVVTLERDALKLELARLRRKYGDNDDTPNPPAK